MWHLRMLNSKVLLAAISLAGLGFANAQTAGPNVARVSYVQGSVQLQGGQGTDFQQAVMNMPVLDGSRLQTGNDGQVEVEFGDGSVARLTPNSSLQFDHLGQDQVQLQQLAGLDYYEFNVGDGHPPFSVQFADINVQPTANTILRVGLDAGWDVAVLAGSVSVQGQSFPAVAVNENQSIHTGDNGTPYALAQGVNGDSWDNWNQDRDQSIAQEASQQTPVRDDSANPQNENWNDLDAYGNWYPVDGNNVWVPSGVDSGWDPYGAGYWADYPTLGYTWVSAYPWGWLPYHCGAWGYYSFGWGWAPGGCGTVWSPVIIVRNHPPGWVMPVHPPLYPPGGAHPLPGRLTVVDRGPVARGPWGFHQGPMPVPNHQAELNFNGRPLAPVQRVDVRPQALTAAHGTAPGSRAFLGGTVPRGGVRVNSESTYMAPNRSYQPQNQMVRPQPGPSEVRPQNVNPRPGVGYAPQQSFNQRSNYTERSMPAPHYSPPPAPHMSAPPASGGGHR
jgi:FecR protein